MVRPTRAEPRNPPGPRKQAARGALDPMDPVSGRAPGHSRGLFRLHSWASLIRGLAWHEYYAA